MTKDEALKLAMEKFEFMNHVDSIFEGEFDFQINAIKEALAQPEPEYLAFMDTPQRTWVGLTDDEKFELADCSDSFEDVVDAVEAALRSKNT